MLWGIQFYLSLVDPTLGKNVEEADFHLNHDPRPSDIPRTPKMLSSPFVDIHPALGCIKKGHSKASFKKHKSYINVVKEFRLSWFESGSSKHF